MELEQKVHRLVVLLDRAVPVLDPFGIGKDRWANWLRADADRLRRGDLGGAEHILGAYGGMGSLTDEVSLDRDTSEGQLFSEIYDLAFEVKRAARSRRLL